MVDEPGVMVCGFLLSGGFGWHIITYCRAGKEEETFFIYLFIESYDNSLL